MKLAMYGMVAALYVVITVLLGAISYGPIQVRFAAGMNVLAAFDLGMMVPLMIGTAIANYAGGLGLLDILIGPLATAGACIGCYILRQKVKIMFLAIPVFSAPILAIYLHLVFELPFWLVLGQIFVGQLVAAYTSGVIIYEVLQRRANERSSNNESV